MNCTLAISGPATAKEGRAFVGLPDTHSLCRLEEKIRRSGGSTPLSGAQLLLIGLKTDLLLDPLRSDSRLPELARKVVLAYSSATRGKQTAHLPKALAHKKGISQLVAINFQGTLGA